MSLLQCYEQWSILIIFYKYLFIETVKSSLYVVVERNLEEEVCRYNAYGVPLTNMMLRIYLVKFLTNSCKADIISDPLSLGCFPRLYKPHDLVTRVDITKIRGNLTVKFEKKKNRYVTHLYVNAPHTYFFFFSNSVWMSSLNRYCPHMTVCNTIIPHNLLLHFYFFRLFLWLPS